MDDDRRAESLVAGADVGAYRIVKRIGVGGTGVVYEAVHRRLDKRVALKTLIGAYRQSQEVRGRFINEGISASRIRHPHVVDITDVGEADGVPYLIMELLEGETLGALARRQGPLSPETIANVMIPVAAGLDEAHRLGVVHRDLKPENIFLTRSQTGKVHPKVLDFGISKVLGDDTDAGLTSDDAFVGTPSYASPEQIDNGRSIEAASDQYSFGVVLYELATGAPPFKGFSSLYRLMRAIANGDCPTPSAENSNVDRRLEKVILRAMSVHSERRYSCMRALGGALLPFADPQTRTLWSTFFEQVDESATRPSIAPPPGAPLEAAKTNQTDGEPAAPAGNEPVSARSTRDGPGNDTLRAGGSRGPSLETPHVAVRTLASQPLPHDEEPQPHPTRPRWLSRIATAALILLGLGSLYAARRGGHDPTAVEVQSLTPASSEPPAPNEVQTTRERAASEPATLPTELGKVPIPHRGAPDPAKSDEKRPRRADEPKSPAPPVARPREGHPRRVVVQAPDGPPKQPQTPPAPRGEAEAPAPADRDAPFLGRDNLDPWQ